MYGNELNGYTKLLTYDMRVPRKVSSTTRSWKFKDKSTLNCCIVNLLSCVRKQKLLVYSRNTGEVSFSKKKISARRVISAMDFLEKEGYIVNYVGVPHPVKDKRRISSAIPTEKLLNIFNFTEEVYKEIEMDYVKNADVVLLRDNPKAQAKYFNSDVISEMVGEGEYFTNTLPYSGWQHSVSSPRSVLGGLWRAFARHLYKVGKVVLNDCKGAYNQ